MDAEPLPSDSGDDVTAAVDQLVETSEVEADERVLRSEHVADLVAGADPADQGDGLRAALADLHDDDVLAAVVDGLASGDAGRAHAFTTALIDVAHGGRDTATAHLAAALVAERTGDPVAAEVHLHQAHRADPGSRVILDRIGWYASDRGDAAAAVRFWRQLELDPRGRRDLDVVTPYATPKAGTLGRNDPCWCGSGRKFKHCHLGEPEPVPLPDRVGWLARKAVMYVERIGPDPRRDVVAMARARAVDPDARRSLAEAFADPIVVDLALVELGWFQRFVEDRGALLPDDEARLARAWTSVARTVYEITDVHPGERLHVRDLRTGGELGVRNRSFSRRAEVGSLICARAVPDGETRQFVGALIPIRPGEERQVLELLDAGDAEAIASWVRSEHA